MSDQDTQKLVEKVYTLLQQTDPNLWEVSDKPLTHEVKVPRPIDTWERVLSMPCSEGTLVFRCSQPVRSNYLVGGYAVVATAGENYLIELRATGWRPVEITEPWRGLAIPNQKYQLLLEGAIAKELFITVQHRIANYESEQRKGFEEKAQEFLKKLPELIHRMRGEDWEKIDDKVTERRYRSEFGDIQVNVLRKSNMGTYAYVAYAEKGNLRVDGKETAVARELFFEIERLRQMSGLLVLGKALENLGENKK